MGSRRRHGSLSNGVRTIQGSHGRTAREDRLERHLGTAQPEWSQRQPSASGSDACIPGATPPGTGMISQVFLDQFRRNVLGACLLACHEKPQASPATATDLALEEHAVLAGSFVSGDTAALDSL